MTTKTATEFPPIDAVITRGRGWMIALGIVTIIVGTAAIMFPLFSSLGVAIIVGFTLVIAGIAQIIAAFSYPRWGIRLLTLVIGLLCLATGVYLLMNPLEGIFALTIIIAAVFIIEGVMKSIYSFRLRPRSGWGWLLFNGIISVLLGIMLWAQFPFSALWALGVLIGLNILISGWTMVVLGISIRSIMGKKINESLDPKVS